MARLSQQYLARLALWTLFLSSSVLSGASAAQAQVGTVTGRVRDARTQAPIAGAHVSVVGTLRVVATRDDGSYSIGLPAGTHIMRASKIGYAPSLDTLTVGAGA